MLKLAPLRRRLFVGVKMIFITLTVSTSTLQAQIIPPEDFIGFKVGEDRRLFGWQKIVNYFKMLDTQSDRVKVQELGRTTLDRPFIMALISSPTNLLNLARYKNLQKQAANPRHLSDEDAKILARQNKLVVMLTLNAQSEEIASSQGSIELAYLLASRNDAKTKRILDNIIVLLVPSLNPDGMQLVVDWYKQYLDSPYEGSPLPVLSHHYAGSDIDRDWVMMNFAETKLLARELYAEWFPQIVYAQYLGPQNGPRLLLPTYADPGMPYVHPTVVSQTNRMMTQVSASLRSQKLPGIKLRASNEAWVTGSTVTSATWHNMIGLTARVAGVQVATPLHFPRGSLKGSEALQHVSRGTNSFAQWPGGWWRLRDVIDTELAAMLSTLDVAATEKESIIYNFCKMNLESINNAKKTPAAYLLPFNQPDLATFGQMLNALIKAGVEIHRIDRGFSAGTVTVAKNSYVIPLAQPFSPYVRVLFARQTPSQFTRNSVTPSPDLVDIPGLALPLMMGIEVTELDQFFEAHSTKIDTFIVPISKFGAGEKGNYLLSHASNQSFILVNRLLNRRKKVYWLKDAISDGRTAFQSGAVFIRNKDLKKRELDKLVEGIPIEIIQTSLNFGGDAAYLLKKFRIGLYRPWTANLDEGWTRFVLEEFEFPFKSIYNTNVLRDNLKGDFEVLIIPDMTEHELINGRSQNTRNIYTPRMPKPYRSGITEKGVENLIEFVEEGGTLIALNRACEFVAARFGLPVESVLTTSPAGEFTCREALLEVRVNSKNPIAYGMPSRASAMVLDSPVFRPLPWRKRTSVPVVYPEVSTLLNGRCHDQARMAGLPAVLEMPLGKGRVVLIAFKAQHRGQTVGTFKLLFNAIQFSNAEEVVLER